MSDLQSAAVPLRIGLILNPLAGVGGVVGLKGSDGLYDEALARGARSQVTDRVMTCLKKISGPVQWLSVPGVMGGDLLASMALDTETVGEISEWPTSAIDTQRGVKALCQSNIDLLLFAGGDGTARDVADAFLPNTPAALGIPCGVKMHSGVFATTPAAAGEMVNRLVEGEMLSVVDAEVRDIDEASFREGIVKTRFYGELPVPDDLRYIQQTKIGGREVEGLVLEEIAADFQENLEAGTLYIMGSGSTIGTIMDAMGLPATLLGIDVVFNGELIASDVGEPQLLTLLAQYPRAKIVVTAISGQGHIFGRGNQQLSPAVIRRVGLDHIQIIATKSKLSEMDHRPLLVDTGDEALDAELSGMKQVLTGYQEYVLYRVN